MRKRTEAIVKGADGKEFKTTKGAPQVILTLSANAGEVKSALDTAVNDYAARGFRSLGVARTTGDGPWGFIGVLPLFDPPREDVKATIATALAIGRTGQDGHTIREMQGFLDRLEGVLREGVPEEKRVVIRQCVEKIEVTRDGHQAAIHIRRIPSATARCESVEVDMTAKPAGKNTG